MVVAPSIITVAKYGFLSLVVTSAGLLIGNIIVVKHHKKPEFADSLVYDQPGSLLPEDFRSMLDINFGRCLTEPSKSFCLLADKKKLQLLRSKEPLENAPGPPNNDSTETIPHPIHAELVEMGKLMAALRTTPVLLEPSMLYCLLSPSNKLNLIKKGFNPYKFQGSRKVVTVGIFEKDAKVLDQEHAIPAFLSAGYSISRSRRWLRANDRPGSVDQYGTVHYFFTRRDLTVHGVVLFKRHAFLWSAGLEKEDADLKDVLFGKETTFENFTAVTLDIENSPELVISIPSSPVRFLHQIPVSEFLECAGVEASNIVSVPHSWLTPLQLRNRAVVSIQELKVLFHPHFISFWLWIKTLTGWSEDCNIYGRTSELNVAVSSKAIGEMNLTSLLAENDYLKILSDIRLETRSALEENVLTQIVLDCYGLRVNIFICFEEKNSVWSYFKTEQGDLLRVVRPKFQLCSAEVYGQRVHVPCDTKPEFKYQISTQDTAQNHKNTSALP